MKSISYLFMAVLLLFSACHKEKGNDECVWLRETTAMSSGFCKMTTVGAYQDCSALQPGDSMSYSLLQLSIHFETQYLPNDVCSTPHDSIVGVVSEFWVVTLNDYNDNYLSGDTLNDIISLRSLDNLGAFSDLRTLAGWLSSGPPCTSDLRLFLTQAPSQPISQSFKFAYREGDGTSYTLETQAVIIIP